MADIDTLRELAGKLLQHADNPFQAMSERHAFAGAASGILALLDEVERLRAALLNISEFNSGEDTVLGALAALAAIRTLAADVLAHP